LIASGPAQKCAFQEFCHLDGRGLIALCPAQMVVGVGLANSFLFPD
jgi:hypothetical protein